MDMRSTYSKSDFLPIEKTDYGYFQKTIYHQPELFHEEVLEIESPFASVIASGTQVFTFLVMGDQNAGKSTFLHSFTYQYDLNFLEITSFLPIISSTFINTRFNFEGEEFHFKPMDEPPFLDTDIAKMTLLLTREDFQFFIDEHSVQMDDKFPDDTRYVVVQFIELGGDHLDSLMLVERKKEITNSKLNDILQRSRNMLLQSKKTIYFANATTLFKVDQQLDKSILTIQEASLQTLLERVRYINSILNHTDHQVLFYISRLPFCAVVDIPSSVKVVESMLAKYGHAELFKRTIEEQTALLEMNDPCVFLKKVLDAFYLVEKWKVTPLNVVPAGHINEDGTLNPTAIVTTLVRCFETKMVHSQQPPEIFVVSHLLECYKEEAEHIECMATSKDDFLVVFWISEDLFRDYLFDLEFSEVPAPILLQKYSVVATKLVEFGIAIQLRRENHSALCVQFVLDNGDVFYWYPNSSSQPKQLAIRFPHYKPLFNLMQNFYTKNLPTEFWLQSSFVQPSDQISMEIRSCADSLSTILQSKWELIRQTHNKDTHALIDTFFWILEEWCLCKRMTEPTSSTYKFSHRLAISKEGFSSLHLSKDQPAEASIVAVQLGIT